jgi:hypothetical protein
LILAIIFFIISTKNVSILLSIIIVIIIGYFYFQKIKENDQVINTNFNNKIKKLNDDIKNEEAALDSNFYINKYPIEFKYLNNDKILIDIILQIRFIKMYDNSKFSKLLLLFENFMKIYIYMLADRYDINDFFSTFIQLRQSIIKELYSIYVVIPMKFKNIYNVDPFKTVKDVIEKFIKHSRKMILTIEKYGFKEKGIYYLEDTQYKPYEKNSLEVF